MMLALTNANADRDLWGKPIHIAARHVVAIRPVGVDKTGLLTVTGVEYTVQESMDAIAKMNAWERA